MKRFFMLSLLAVLIAATGRKPLSAADDVLDIVPNDALAVVVVNNMEETAGKLADTAGKLKLPPMNVLALAKAQTGITQGIDDKGSLGIAVVPGAMGAPTLLAIIPTSDYKALIEPFSVEDPDANVVQAKVRQMKIAIAKKGDFVVACQAKDADVLKKALAAEPLSGDVEGLKPWLAEQQAFAIATPTGIKMAQAQALAGLAMVKAQLEGQGDQAKTAVAGLSFYESIFKALDKEISYCAIGVQLDDDGSIHLLSRSLLAEGGVLAKASESAGEGQQDLLKHLPQGPFVFAAGGVYPESLAKEMMGVSMSMMQSLPGGDKMTPEELEQMIEISKDSMKGMRSMAMFMGVGEEGQSLYSDMVIVLDVESSPRYMKTYAEVMKKMSDAMGEDAFLKFETAEVDIDGRSALELTVDMKSLLTMSQDPKAEAMMATLFGKDGKLPVYMTPVDKNTIVGAYVSKDRLSKAIKAIEQDEPELADDPDVAKTLAMLPEGSQWVALWSLQGTRSLVVRMIGAIEPDIRTKVPELPASPPIGMSAKLSPGTFDTAVVLPMDAIQAVSIFVRKMLTSNDGAAVH